MFGGMLSVDLVWLNTGKGFMVVSRGRGSFTQVKVPGCDGGQVEKDMINQMTRQLGQEMAR